MTTTLHATEPFDLISAPDEDSRALRETLHGWTLGASLVTGSERAVVSAKTLRTMCGDAHDLITGLLMLRRALVVLMQSTGTEALALPFLDLAKASLVPLRVKHDPRALPGLLQVMLPGEGLVSFDLPTPGAGYDSTGDDEAVRLRWALGEAQRLLQNDAGRDTLLALITATLRT